MLEPLSLPDWQASVAILKWFRQWLTAAAEDFEANINLGKTGVALAHNERNSRGKSVRTP